MRKYQQIDVYIYQCDSALVAVFLKKLLLIRTCYDHKAHLACYGSFPDLGLASKKACADPEIFVRGDSALITFLL